MEKIPKREASWSVFLVNFYRLTHSRWTR